MIEYRNSSNLRYPLAKDYPINDNEIKEKAVSIECTLLRKYKGIGF